MKRIAFIFVIVLVFSACEMKKFDNDKDVFAQNDNDISEIDSDEPTGEDDNDEYSDNDNDTENNDEDEITEEIPCKSVYLDGVDSFVMVYPNTMLKLGSSWTIEAWAMQGDDLNDMPIISKGDSTHPSYWLSGRKKNQAVCYGGINTASENLSVTSKDAVALGKWYHIALVKTENVLSLYLNGVPQGDITAVDNPESNDEKLYIGALFTDVESYFRGYIDSVRISWSARYRDVFTPEKTLEADTETISVWNFSEKEGEVTNSENENVLKGYLKGNARFVEKCAAREQDCVYECFSVDETPVCNDGVLRSCVQNTETACFEYEENECTSGFCSNDNTCGEADCTKYGLSKCEAGEEKICINIDGYMRWSESRECSGQCKDPKVCLSCDNECEKEGDTKCEDGKYSICVLDDCLKWSEAVECNVGCEDSQTCANDGWRSVATGMSTCGIDENSNMYCWNKSKEIQSLGKWMMISASENHACAVSTGGDIYCSGLNDKGQLGDGTLDYRIDPVYVDTQVKMKYVDAYMSVTSAVSEAGEWYAWGESVLVPTKIDNGTNWEKVSGNCGIALGQLYCKDGMFGEIHKVDDRDNWTEIAVGSSHACGIADGELFCWGSNEFGETGGNQGTLYETPQRVGADSDWTKVDVGDRHSCGIRNGELYCWGSNDSGQIGKIDYSYVYSPVKIGSFNSWKDINLSAEGSCGIADNNVYCWGKRTKVFEEEKHPFLFNVKEQRYKWRSVSIGTTNACGIVDGILHCWENSTTSPSKLEDISKSFFNMREVDENNTWEMLSGGQNYFCGVRGGELFCWGKNTYGNLGNGTTIDDFYPKKIGTKNTWEKVSAGTASTCGISDGVLYCWGGNNYGATGVGSIDQSEYKTPEKIGEKNSWSEISVGYYNVCGISRGELYCWGKDFNSYSPKRIGERDDWTYIEANNQSVCGIAGGLLYCYGPALDTIRGFVNQSVFNEYLEQASDITGLKSVSMSYNAVYALKTNGEIVVWYGDMIFPGYDPVYYPEIISGSKWKSLVSVLGSEVMCAIDDTSNLYCSLKDQLLFTPMLLPNP